MGMWKIGDVTSVTDGWAFNITNESGKPLVTFEYETNGEAAVAARHVQEAIEKALAVRPLGETQAPT